MSYHIDKNPESGEKELVIDGFEKGIADSPYMGIANMRNVNSRYYGGVAYLNYRRQAATISGGTMKAPIDYATSPSGTMYILDSSGQVWKAAANATTFTLIGGATENSGTGIAYWNNYLIVARTTRFDVYGDGTGDAAIITANVNLQTNTGTLPLGNVYNLKFSNDIFGALSGSFTAGLSTGDTSGTLTSSWSGATGVYQISFDNGDTFNGTFTNGSTAVTWTTGLTSTATDSIRITSLTGHIDTYTAPDGTVHTDWAGYTGNYLLVNNTQKMLASFVYSSTTVTFVNLPFYQVNAGQPFSVNIINTSTPILISPGPTHKMLVSKNDGILYFCNGNAIGSFEPSTLVHGSEGVNPITFNLAGFVTTNYLVLGLPPDERSVWLTDLVSKLIISGLKDLYPWDGLSAFWENPVPVNEPISKVINILNILYILAGQKGNIYHSNGYSVSVLKKIPDYIAGVIDPIWAWGGFMAHRSKLYFQALASDISGTRLLSGIFCLDTAPTIATEVSNSLTMDAQNSFGLVTTTTVANGVLIDNTPSTNGNDSYYSAWGNGTSSGGGIDYNDTTVWQNWEAMIESDIIPIGTILTGATLAQIEFKLDRPMATGDEIRISSRKSLTDTYVVLGTTTTAVLSDIYNNNNLNGAQWVQFLVEYKGASSGPSRIPVREVRLHYGN